MGNCCNTGSSMDWGGDDWGSLSSKHKRRMSSRKVFDEVHGLSLGNVEKEKLLGALRASSDADGKVKIKISKKELDKLLGKGTENQSAEQVLVHLMNARDHHAHHRQWKPVLQSIPESSPFTIPRPPHQLPHLPIPMPPLLLPRLVPPPSSPPLTPLHCVDVGVSLLLPRWRKI
ncbi:hypothetical protein RJT34_14197 [Clitoria ternatea]|uniref:Uncharacterized protein n=1 Tax=Clitoria ternatea TaxID=43366 RepID=A0AAN9JTG2_CLITE